MKTPLPIILFLALAVAVSAENITYDPATSTLVVPSTTPTRNYENAPNVPSFFPLGIGSDNTVIVPSASGTLNGHVFGGVALNSGDDSSDNRVRIEGYTIGTTTTGGNVFGGWTDFGNVNDNTIDITGNTAIYGIVFGGWINGGRDNEAKDNTVTINGADVTLRGNVYGAYTQGGSEMTDNSVAITGSSVWKLDAIIAGAYSALNTSTITENTVTIGGNANVRRGAVYGGRGQGASVIRNNTVTIDGGAIGSFGTGSTIYGGHNFNGNGAVWLNEVVIKDGAVNAAIYGGASTSGAAYDNTVFIYDGSVTGNIYGGYSTRGIAAGVERQGNRVQIGRNVSDTPELDSANLFGGFVASGGGDAFTRNALNVYSSFTANSAQNFEYIVFYDSGFTFGFDVKIGTLDTTPTGSAQSGVRLEVYNDNTVNFTGNIIGEGSLTKAGGGTFLMDADSSINIDGALTIEQGTLHLQTGNIRTDGSRSEGIITFTGDRINKRVIVDSVSELEGVSFRTAEGAGEGNRVELTGNLEIFYDEDRAFYVAKDTTMTVNATGHLVLDINYHDDRLGDVFVDEGGVFNLNVSDQGLVEFYSGIEGEGTLNITTDDSGMVILSNYFHVYGARYKIGDTNITGGIALDMMTGPDAPRFMLETDTFTMTGTGSWVNPGYGTALLAGGGIIQANRIDISENVVLSPDEYRYNETGRWLSEPSTMTLRAGTVNLTDFSLFYSGNADENTTQKPLVWNDGVWESNNSLLYIDSNNITLSASSNEKNVIAVTTLGGGRFVQGDYLLVHTPAGFNGITSDGQVDALFTVVMDGFVISDGTVRGSYSLHLGGAPDNTSQKTAGNTSLWLTHDLNSLTMDWTGAENNTWGGENFRSVQERDTTQEEKNFMSGDFVRFFPAGSLYIGLENDVTVSGLEVNGTSDVTFSGEGGILADIDSAFGLYVEDGTLEPTGKLEKSGTGTLTFTNTGGNLFLEGIDIHAGTIAIVRGDQLQAGGDGITFKGSAVLDSTGIVELNTPIVVNSGFTATLHTPNVADTLLLAGGLTGVGGVTKTGAGTLYVFSGVNYTPTTFTLSGGTLAGNGIIESNSITINSNLSPDSAYNLAGTPAHPDDRFGTLTLEGTAITLGNSTTPFTMDFDIDARSGGNDEWKDLLVLQGNGTTIVNENSSMSGTIKFHGALHSDNEYLIIRGLELDADTPYNFATGGINASLSASLNDITIDNEEGSPRGYVVFALGDDEGTKVSGTNIWLIPHLNSLTMNWTAGSKEWNYTEEFDSLQDDGADHTYHVGDEMLFFAKENEGPITITVAGAVAVSGLKVGAEAIWEDDERDLKIHDDDVTFDGIGSINVNGSLAHGKYSDGTAPTEPQVEHDGKLHKYGEGTLTFANTGGNTFESGIDLHGGILQFDLADQLGNADITFKKGATLKPIASVALSNNIKIEENVTAKFDVANAANALLLSGNLSGQTGNIAKTGEGILQLSANNSGTVQKTDVEEGTFRITSAFGTNNLTVHRGGTLAGGGTININVAVIDNGGADDTAHGRISPDSAVFTADKTTIDGDEKFGTLTFVGQGVGSSLTFGAGSVFDVDLAKDAAGTLHRDLIAVRDAVVNINSEAILHVKVDYWSGSSENVMIIDARQGTVGNPEAKFDEFLIDPLPRGVSLEQLGWVGLEFLLGVRYNAEEGFGGLCIQHNRREIGTSLDWFIENHGPGDLHHLITALSDPSLTDEEVCKMLDQITGDLTPNAMLMALKEPWRYPFHRLALGCPVHDNGGKNFWGEFTARYENIGYDNNAHSSTINRYGLAVGVDRRITSNSVWGATFQYTEPRLRQATGKATMEDHEFGVYALTRLAHNFEAKSYLGYSHQRYDFTRRVAFMDEHLTGKTSGDALSMSVELTRPLYLAGTPGAGTPRGILLRPLVALDYEQTWMRGYRESGGTTALIYDKATLARTMFRIGLNGDFALQNGLTLTSRLQYGTQLNDREHGAVGVRFVEGGADQRTASIWGSRIGRDYVNLGIGGGWKLNRRGDALFVNYDAKWYERAALHVGEAGFVGKW